MNDPLSLRIECVLPIESHAMQIMDWRNDPLTLKMSYHSEPKTRDVFFKEFRENYFSLPDLPPIFILQEEERVAFIRFTLAEHPLGQKERRCSEISINVAPDHRKKGIGTQALFFIQEWVRNQGYDDIYAEVLNENTSSQQAFRKAGYAELEPRMKQIDIRTPRGIKRYLFSLTPSDKNEKVLIIAEAGSNWRMGSPKRDMEMAKTLIETAAESGADVIKFQTFYPSGVYAQGAGRPDYFIKEGIDEDVLEVFKDLTMPHEMIPELAAYCAKLSIEFMSTPFSPRDFAAVDPFVKRHKIASYEISHLRLIELAAKSGKPVLMSTGAAIEEEIAWAVDTFRENGGVNLTLLQCTAAYPADPKNMNLRVLPWLKNRYKVPVGLSDHSRHPTCAPTMAVALGGSVVEKHFTLNNRLPGPDHAFALTPSELKEMVVAVRAAEQMRGSYMKAIDPEEKELRLFLQRRVQATQEILPETVLKEGVNIEILRPGKQIGGVHPKNLNSIEGKRALKHKKIGEGIQVGDWG